MRFKTLHGALIASVLLAALPARAIDVGAAAPAFSLDQLGGGKLSLAELKGHVVYLDFWASWCGPCKQTFPFMNDVQARYAPRGLKVVAINVDERSADANKFLAEVPATFTVLMVHASYNESEKAALTQQIEKALAGAKP